MSFALVALCAFVLGVFVWIGTVYCWLRRQVACKPTVATVADEEAPAYLGALLAPVRCELESAGFVAVGHGRLVTANGTVLNGLVMRAEGQTTAAWIGERLAPTPLWPLHIELNTRLRRGGRFTTVIGPLPLGARPRTGDEIRGSRATGIPQLMTKHADDVALRGGAAPGVFPGSMAEWQEDETDILDDIWRQALASREIEPREESGGHRATRWHAMVTAMLCSFDLRPASYQRRLRRAGVSSVQLPPEMLIPKPSSAELSRALARNNRIGLWVVVIGAFTATLCRAVGPGLEREQRRLGGAAPSIETDGGHAVRP